MIRPKAFTFALVLAMACAGQASAQVFFRMDFSPGAQPDAGWNATDPGATHSRTFIAGGGPNGENVYELTQRHTGSSSSHYGGEYYWGWTGNIEAQNPAQGARRYYRFRMRFSPGTNFRGTDSDGSSTTLTNKVLILGDGCGRDCRVILNYRGQTNGRTSLKLQIDGGAHLIETNEVAVGQWFTVQIEVDSSTTTSSRDGSYKIWINNNNYNSPSAQTSGFQLNPTNWRWVLFGAYENDGLAANGEHSFRLSGFEASTTFDPNFHTGGGTNTQTPAAPTNLRVIPPQ